MIRLVARVYDTAIRALSRLAIGWTPNVDRDPLYDPGRELDDRDVDLWCKQAVAEAEDITRGRWCAKSREGWCALSPDTEPSEGVSFVATVCGFGITLPGGFEHRHPDCPDCLAATTQGAVT